MKIKMLDSESTHVQGKAGHYYGGREYDLPDNVARAWIEKRIAELVVVPRTTTPKKVKGD